MDSWYDILSGYWIETTEDSSTTNYVFNGLKFEDFVKILKSGTYRNGSCVSGVGISYSGGDGDVEINKAELYEFCISSSSTISQSDYISEYFDCLVSIWSTIQRSMKRISPPAHFILAVSNKCK